jgi:transcriptional regulator with XRE-family HTH domain
MNAGWFAGRLRELREAAGLTQQQLAEKAGLTREGVAQLETGRREPAWRTVVSLCRALGTSCEAFLQEPSAQPGVKPGRPRKAAAPPEREPDQAKAGDMPPPQRKPARRKPPRPRGA